MGPVERIFGGVLLASLLIVGVFFVMSTGPTTGGPALGGDKKPTTVVAKSPTGENRKWTECGCYEAAFKGAGEHSVVSAAYKTGFKRCRQMLGQDGSDAWTAGWTARSQGMGGRMGGCKAYQKNKSS